MNTSTQSYQRHTREEWRELIEAFEQSNQPLNEFCDQHEISYQSFVKWRSTFRSSSKKTAPSLVEITPSQPPSAIGWSVELSISDSIVLRIR